MRQSAVLSLLTFALFFGSARAHAVPVFLKPESRFATGNLPRAKLELRTKKIQIQRWFRVKTKDKAYGWLAEDHALTALKLVEQATLIETVPARSTPDFSVSLDPQSAFGHPVISRSTPVMILEIQGSWARVQPLTETEVPQSWIPLEKLKPNFALNIAQRAFVYQTSRLYVDADRKSRVLMKIEEGTYVQLLRVHGDWLEVRSDRYQGYVSKADVWTALDLGEKGVRAAISLAPLRASPLPYAELVRSLPYSSTLTFVTSTTLRWGFASTREQGNVWWPMTDEASAAKEVASFERTERTSDVTEKIGTAQLFSRKIFDMATSRSVPSLKFASADGIYRTNDGVTWTKIPLFREQNYPIAVSKSGSIFIGPYVSDDLGETFQQWIRWDSLVSSLSINHDVSAQNLKILEIRPEDAAGHKVTLRLNVGLSEPIRVATEDQGVSWKSF